MGINRKISRGLKEFYESGLLKAIAESKMNHTSKESVIPFCAWVSLAVVVIILLVTHIYNDILITAKQSVGLWDAFFSGRIKEFYDLSIMTLNSNYYTAEQGAGYPFLTYLFLAVWNLPVWISGKIAGYGVVEAYAAKVWIKIIILLALIVSCDMIYRIIYKAKGDKREAIGASFFFASSLLVLMNGFVISQIDIIGVCLILVGIKFWMEDKQGSFIFIFSIGTGFKYFPLLAFTPMLLLREKKIYRIILKTVCVLAPSVLFQLLLGGSGNVSDMIAGFFSVSFQMGAGVFLPFLFAVMLLCLFCYAYRLVDAENNFSMLAMALFVIFGALRLFVNILPYWGIYFALGLTLVLPMMNENKREAILLESVICAGVTFLDMIRFAWVYDGRLIREMGVVLKLFGLAVKPDRTVWMNINEAFTVIGLNSDYVKVTVYTLVLACVVMLFIFALRGMKSSMNGRVLVNSHLDPEEIKAEMDHVERLYITRFVVNAVIALLPMVFHVIYVAVG